MGYDSIPNTDVENGGNTIPTVFRVHPEKWRLFSYISFWVAVGLAIFVSNRWVFPNITCEIDGVTQHGKDCSHILAQFGYNNMCVYFDYAPAVTMMGLLFPVVEYGLVGYVIFDYLQLKNDFQNGLFSSGWLMVLHNVLFWFKVVFLAWFRMCFINKVTDDPIPFFGGEIEPLFAHTMGFWCMQIALVLIAFENVLFLSYRDQGMWCFNPKQTKLLAYTYLVALAIVTLIKIIWGISVFSENGSILPIPMAQSLDVAWTILAAVLPVFFAWNGIVKDPEMVITITNTAPRG